MLLGLTGIRESKHWRTRNTIGLINKIFNLSLRKKILSERALFGRSPWQRSLIRLLIIFVYSILSGDFSFPKHPPGRFRPQNTPVFEGLHRIEVLVILLCNLLVSSGTGWRRAWLIVLQLSVCRNWKLWWMLLRNGSFPETSKEVIFILIILKRSSLVGSFDLGSWFEEPCPPLVIVVSDCYLII